MAGENKIDVTRGEFTALKELVAKLEANTAGWLENYLKRLERVEEDFHRRAGDLAERVDAIAKHPGLSIPPLPGGKSASEFRALGRAEARALRAKGEAVLPLGTPVRFRQPDGLGPAEGWAAIVCDARIIREGFAARYTLWVLVPKKPHWEEGVTEGPKPGEFEVA